MTLHDTKRSEKIADAVSSLLRATGLDCSDPDLKHTPERVSAIWQQEFLAGYSMDPQQICANPVVEPHDPDAVFVMDLAFHSMCPHHLLPFQGQAHVAYVPGGKLLGFGRVADLVTCYTRRLTLQERATHQIADALMTHLGARGAGCVLVAKQLCLGIPADTHAANHVVTSAFLGVFRERQELRERLLRAAT